MVYIVLTDEQKKIIAESPGQVEFRDRDGKHLGFLSHGVSEEDIAIAKRRLASNEPRYTTAQVMAHLQSLENR